MEPARFDDTLTAGDTYPVHLTVQDETVDGDIGNTAIFHIRRDYNSLPVISKTATVNGTDNSVGTGGQITFLLTKEDTRALDTARNGFHKFVYNIQLDRLDFNDTQTLMIGQLRVIKDLAI